MTENYILAVIAWLACLFSLTSGIVFVVYSFGGGKHEVLSTDRSDANRRWNNFMGVGNGADSGQANPRA
jgi:hypothetical protein